MSDEQKGPEFPHCRAVGIKIEPGDPPRVKFKTIREGLGQWRYGFAFRLMWFAPLPKKGLPADRVESVLVQMAHKNKLWPEEWLPPGFVRGEGPMDELVQEQPAPNPNASTPIWELVIADMQARDHTGRQRYGTPLQAGNGRDALIDAYQEALDLCVYLRQAIEERRLPEPPK